MYHLTVYFKLETLVYVVENQENNLATKQISTINT